MLFVLFQEIAVCPASGGFSSVDFDSGFFDLKVLGVEQIVDGDWVVVGGVGPIIDFYIKFLVVFDHIDQGLSEEVIGVFFEFIVDLLICQEEMSDF